MTVSAFPLAWPEGWPRTPFHEREMGNARYRGGTWRDPKPLTMARAQRGLYDELERLGASSLVVSSNLVRNLDGSIRSNQRRPDDPGVAIYFQHNGKPMVMAMDDFHEPEANVRRLALAIKAMRDLERNGGGTMAERAFTGFAALPAPIAMGEDPAITLGLTRPFTADDVTHAARRLAKEYHPDRPGGDAEKMKAVNAAKEAALRELA